MASLVWGLLRRGTLAEGAAASASFGVIGYTGDVEAVAFLAGVVCHGRFPNGEAGAFGLWHLWGWFLLLGVLGGVCFCCPLVYGLFVFPLVVHTRGLC